MVSVYFEKTFGSEGVGLLFGIDSLAAALSGYLLGKLIGRYGAKKFYLLAIAGYAIAFLSYAFAKSLPMMVAVAILSGVKWAMTIGVSSTYVATKVKAVERGQAMGLLNAVMSLGWVIGPFIGGYLSSMSFELNFTSTLVPLGLAFSPGSQTSRVMHSGGTLSTILTFFQAL